MMLCLGAAKLGVEIRVCGYGWRLLGMPCHPQHPGAAPQNAARGLPNVSSPPAITKLREIFGAACVALHSPNTSPSA